MEENRIRVAITQGDTNGVGWEVIFKTFSEAGMLELCTPIVYGNPRTASYHRKCLNMEVAFAAIQDGGEAQPERLNLVVCDDTEIPVTLGRESTEGGRQAWLALERAVADCRDGKADVLVTAPINKHAMQQSGEFPFPGHTEYLQETIGEGDKALMLMTGDKLRIALATNHLPVSQIASSITVDLLVEKLAILHKSLQRDFGIRAPRIAVLALNPHAGDNGVLGTEERDIIVPAIKKACDELGIRAFGPYPADGFFGMASYGHFDGILAMYHDQGLVPFKALSMGDGVNFTAGLPVVRTSPDHGTAYDIVGRGEADETSFRNAVYAAIDILRQRRLYDEASRNPLEKLYHEYHEDERRVHRRSAEESDEE